MDGPRCPTPRFLAVKLTTFSTMIPVELPGASGGTKFFQELLLVQSFWNNSNYPVLLIYAESRVGLESQVRNPLTDLAAIQEHSTIQNQNIFIPAAGWFDNPHNIVDEWGAKLQCGDCWSLWDPVTVY